jgi:hypothetical protein
MFSMLNFPSDRITWFRPLFDPVTMALGTAAITAGTAGLGFLEQKKQQKKVEGLATATPALQPTVRAPTERSPDILSETERQLSGLSGKGREGTRLAKKKRGGSLLDEGDGFVDTSPAYTNTTLG